MGCPYSRSQLKVETPKDLFTGFEDSLGYCNLRSKDIDNTFHRYSFSDLIPHKNLVKALQTLKIPYQQFSVFYDKFAIKRNSSQTVMYSRKKLCCLGILLGQSTEAEKIKLLFQNYDIETNQILDLSEIKCLISDISFVSIEIIPEGLFAKEPQSDLKMHIDELKHITPLIIDFYVYCFIENTHIIDFATYVRIFNKAEVKKLINPYELRAHCVNIQKKCIKNKANAFKLGLAGILEDVVNISLKLIKSRALE